MSQGVRTKSALHRVQINDVALGLGTHLQIARRLGLCSLDARVMH